MVAREIGEHRSVEVESVDTPLIEAVRGDFHCYPFRPAIDKLAQDSLELNRAGRGEVGTAGNDFSLRSKKHTQRSDRRAARGRIIEQVAKDSGGGTLSVRSRYSDD